MPLFFFDALFLVLLLLLHVVMLHLRFSQEGCLLHTSTHHCYEEGGLRLVLQQHRSLHYMTVCSSSFFFTHNIVHELHVWTVRRMSISSPFHIAFSSDNICYVLDNSASRFISICAYYLLMWVFVHSMYTHICEVENDSSKMILYVLEHMSIGISRGT